MKRNKKPVQITISHNPNKQYSKISDDQVRRAKQRARIDEMNNDKALERQIGEVWDE